MNVMSVEGSNRGPSAREAATKQAYGLEGTIQHRVFVLEIDSD